MSEQIQVVQAVPEGIRIARLALLRDFDELMANQKTRGKFVCYHLDKLVAINKDYLALIRELNAKNLPSNASLILLVEPSEAIAERDALEEIEID